MAEFTVDNAMTEDETARASRGRRCSIRTVVLVAVNLPVILLAGAILPAEYRQAIAEQVGAKQLDLEEEAKAVHPAITQLVAHGRLEVQRYLDSVCALMRDAQSPGHHLVVELDGEALQADSHHRASPEILSAMRKAATTPTRRVRFGDGELVVGAFEAAGARVLVAESLANIESSARSGVFRRLLGFLVIAAAAATVVSIALVQAVSKPIEGLTQTVRRIGRGQLGTQTGSLLTRELNYLARELNAMSDGLAKSEKTRALQMSKAREVQHNLLPNGVSPTGFSIASLFEPAEDVGGDFYDIVRLSDDSWLVFVADVSGHGIPAAMTAAVLKSLVAQAAACASSPATILEEVNRGFLLMSLDGDFATAIALRLDTAKGHLNYASAGHDPGWLLSCRGAARELSSTGMPLGVHPEADWEETAIDLTGRERLLLVTDGICESSNARGKLFGRERIGELLEANRTASAARLLELLDGSLRTHRGETPQTDDVTAILLEITNLDGADST